MLFSVMRFFLVLFLPFCLKAINLPSSPSNKKKERTYNKDIVYANATVRARVESKNAWKRARVGQGR